MCLFFVIRFSPFVAKARAHVRLGYTLLVGSAVKRKHLCICQAWVSFRVRRGAKDMKWPCLEKASNRQCKGVADSIIVKTSRC